MKAILVIDMPSDCNDCLLCRYAHNMEPFDEDEAYCEKLFKSVKKEISKETKPDWCPLKPMPEKKEATQLPISPLLPKQYTVFEKGYNACIDEILGDKE